MPYTSAFAVVRNGVGEILLILREDGQKWTLPGGSLMKGEIPRVGVTRITQLKTGIEILVSKMIGIFAHVEVEGLSVAYSAQPTGGEIYTSSFPAMVSDCRYFSPVEIAELGDSVYNAQQRIIVDALLARRRGIELPLESRFTLPTQQEWATVVATFKT